MRTILTFIYITAIAAVGGEITESAPDQKGFQRLVKYIPRLHYPRKDRWPILSWDRLPKSDREMQAWIDRGICPLGLIFRSKNDIARLKQIQKNQVPLVLLSQGILQRIFKDPPESRKNKFMQGCDHLPPALPRKKSKDFNCPAFMYENPALKLEAAQVTRLCNFLKQNGLNPEALFIDFETGAYLRNGAEKPKRLDPAMREAAKCPRCIKRFDQENLNTMEKYSDIVNQARAYATKKGFVEPVRKIFPECVIGNFYSWPVKRTQKPDNYAAYGYEGSGMNVAQPRQYITAGWRGCGNNEKLADWVALHDCLKTFSPCAKVLKQNEIFTPWIGLVPSRNHIREKQGKVYPTVEGLAEVTRHMMLRKAETICVFNPGGLDKDFPDSYGDFPRKNRGPWILFMEGIQRGYDDMLRFHDLLRKGKVMNLEQSGDFRKLDKNASAWSGVKTDKVALVRTVTYGPPHTGIIEVFNHKVKVPFTCPGKFYWITPAGKVIPVAQNK